VGDLRNAVATLQAKLRDQEVVLIDLGERLAARDWGAHDRLRVVEASMASLRLRIDALESHPQGQESEAKNFSKVGTLQRIEAQQAQLLEAFKGRHECNPSAEAQDRCEDRSARQSEKLLLDVKLEKRLVALEAVTEDMQTRLRSDLKQKALAKANSAAVEAQEPTKAKVFSCLENATQVATRALASLDASLKSVEVQVSSMTATLTACCEEQQRQAAELKELQLQPLSQQVAGLESSSAHQEQRLQDIHQWQLKVQDDIHSIQATNDDFGRQIEHSDAMAEQKEATWLDMEAVMQGLQDGKIQLCHMLKNILPSLRAELGERHTMLEERLSRTQNRVAQEIGEQRVHTESRLRQLEDEARARVHPEALEKLKEVDTLQQSMEFVEKRLQGISKCLQTLYRKVGLSAREVLAVQDVGLSTESEDVWVGPGFCHLRSPRFTFAGN